MFYSRLKGYFVDAMDLGFKVKTVKDLSILHRLRNRETFISKPNTHHHVARKFYCNILPNFTIIDVENPPCFLRKFSPDGRYFVAFSSDQASLEIYSFKGNWKKTNTKNNYITLINHPNCSNMFVELHHWVLYTCQLSNY